LINLKESTETILWLGKIPVWCSIKIGYSNWNADGKGMWNKEGKLTIIPYTIFVRYIFNYTESNTLYSVVTRFVSARNDHQTQWDK